MTVDDVARDVLISLKDNRITLSGPELRIPPRMALSLSMADEGKVDVTWGVNGEDATR